MTGLVMQRYRFHADTPPMDEPNRFRCYPDWEPICNNESGAFVDMQGTELDESEWLFVPLPPAPTEGT